MTESHRKNKNPDKQNSLFKLADNLVTETKQLLSRVKTEEDLRIGFEKVLESIKNELGIASIPKNVHRSYISGIERGARNPLSKNIDCFARAADIDISELFKF